MRWGLLCCLPFCLLLAPGKHAGPAAPPVPHLSALVDDGRPLPSPSEMEALASADPVAFLEACWKRSRREVRGFACRLHKRETIGGTEFPPEEVEVAFRASPHAVSLRWHAGARKVALGVVSVQRALYAAGENGDQVVALVAGPFRTSLQESDPYGGMAREASRYPMPEFGMEKAVERTWRAWRASRNAGTLNVEYRGVVPVPEVGGRACHVLVRTVDPPEEEGLTRVELAVDAENWLQVSSKLTAGDKRIGEYHFRDVRLNPDLDPARFTKAALSPR